MILDPRPRSGRGQALRGGDIEDSFCQRVQSTHCVRFTSDVRPASGGTGHPRRVAHSLTGSPAPGTLIRCMPPTVRARVRSEYGGDRQCLFVGRASPHDHSGPLQRTGYRARPEPRKNERGRSFYAELQVGHRMSTAATRCQRFRPPADGWRSRLLRLWRCSMQKERVCDGAVGIWRRLRVVSLGASDAQTGLLTN